MLPTPETRKPAPGGPARKRPRLLLIDDELAVARYIGHAAEECGYEAVITVTSESFRSQYRAAPPDVVALDLALPRSDGVELLRFLAEESCQARILLISGFDTRVVDSAMRLGLAMGLDMATPLSKPVRLHDLMEAIAEPTEKARAACLHR